MPKRVLIGTVVSDKGDKTVTVRVERRVKHSLYGKIIRRSKKYHAHDTDNVYRVGEQVRIEECAPISKTKTWTVVERLGAAKAAVIDIDEPSALSTEKGTKTETKAEKPAEKAEKPAKASKSKAKSKDVADADA